MDEIVGAVASIIPLIVRRRSRRKTISRNSSLTGEMYYQELINSQSVARFREVARMSKEIFILLLEALTDLIPSQTTSAGQKLMIFLSAITGNSNRTIQERWQHSGDTVSKIIHEVAASILVVESRYVSLPMNPILHSSIQNNHRYYPYFKDCIGAIDGTHIPAVVPLSLSRPFRNRKGVISQNVLATCSFDMCISYSLAGWEGSAHDGRVYEDALSKGFPERGGKYFLGDAGYGLSASILTPYRGTRYHLKEWRQGSLSPQNSKELFNLRHSTLRNVIERVFGVMKKRFPLLTTMTSYKFHFQVEMIRCIFVLQNFIRMNQLYDDPFDSEPQILDRDIDDISIESSNNAALNSWRDGIAERMWSDYLLQRNL